jgi:hypothetical protein
MKKLVSVLMALMVTPLLAAGSDVAGKWTNGKRSTVPVEPQLVGSLSPGAGGFPTPTPSTIRMGFLRSRCGPSRAPVTTNPSARAASTKRRS